jgi:hypothetical protein
VWEVEPVREVADQECEGGKRARANANESLQTPAPVDEYFIRRGMKRGPSISMSEISKRQCRYSRIGMMRGRLIEVGSPVKVAATRVVGSHSTLPSGHTRARSGRPATCVHDILPSAEHPPPSLSSRDLPHAQIGQAGELRSHPRQCRAS